MQQDKNIESKLREMENLEQADLSHIEDHWKQMYALLPQPAVPAGGKPTGSFEAVGYSALAAVLVAGFIYFSGILTTTEKKPEAGVQAATKLVGDFDTTLHKQAASKTLFVQLEKKVILSKTGVQKNSQAGLSFNHVINKKMLHWHIMDSTDSISGNSAAIGLPTISRRQLLVNFLTGLEKQKQEFFINNERDTFLAGKEGTVIYIPAYSFNKSGQVKISLGEYYRYSDIILNRLVTTSSGQQLISGGMFEMEAKSGSEKTTLQPGRKLTAYIPGITEKDSFSIFNGYTTNSGESLTKISDWQLSNVRIDSPVLKMFIRAVDLRDNVAEISLFRNYSNLKAVFPMARGGSFSKDELKVMLREKYGSYYDKIKVKHRWNRDLLFRKIDEPDNEWGDVVSNAYGVGDTADFTPLSIRIYKLKPIDTVYKVVNWIHKGRLRISQPVLNQEMTNAVAEKYNISLDKLGWINCDRFNNVPGQRTNYVVDLKDSAYSYFTVMVFEKYKSVLAGKYASGTMVSFANVPATETFKIISIGVDRSGNTVYAIKQGPFKSSLIEGLQFEPASAPVLKTVLSNFD